MTDATPPPVPNFPPPTPKKSRTNLIILASAAAVITAVIGTGIVVVQSGGGGSTPATTTAGSSSPDQGVVTAAAEEPDLEPTYAEVDAADFTVKLRTTERHCFGSAGCNVTVEPDLTLLMDSSELDPDVVYEITYEIRGDESGPVVETAELSNRTSLNFTPSLISAASSGTKLSVEITDVTVREY